MNILKTGTFWSVAFGAAAHVAGDYRSPVAWMEAISAVLAAYRIRAAIAKNGVGA